MFEADTSRNSLMQGLIRSGAAAKVATQRASSANEAALGLAAVLQMRNDRIAELELALLVKTALGEGLTAQLKGFIAAHPDSTERRDSGKRFKDGTSKNVGRIRFETAHDAFLVGKGIPSPAQHRDD